jgi:hypothetical protein
MKSIGMNITFYKKSSHLLVQCSGEWELSKAEALLTKDRKKGDKAKCHG